MSQSDPIEHRPIGHRLSSLILEYLCDHPEECLRVHGRRGGQPNIRYDPNEGKYKFATWTGVGVMKGHHDTEAVRGLIQSGPRMELEPVSRVDAFDQPEVEF